MAGKGGEPTRVWPSSSELLRTLVGAWLDHARFQCAPLSLFLAHAAPPPPQLSINRFPNRAKREWHLPQFKLA